MYNDRNQTRKLTMGTYEKMWANADFNGLIRTFSETSSAAMVVTDTKGIIVWCNHTLADICEETEEDLIGSHFGTFVVYPQGTDVGARMQQAIERGYTDLLKTKWVSKSGKEKFMHQRTYRLDGKDGTHLGFWGIAYELTQEKKSIDDSKTALRVLTEIQAEELKAKQLEVVEMLKVQSDLFCPGKSLRGEFCPAILAVEESIIKDRPSLKALLTNTELKIAAHVKEGWSIKDIADKLCISQRTVKNHRHAIRKKLNITHTNISLTNFLQGFPL